MKFRGKFISAFVILTLALAMTCQTVFATVQTESVRVTAVIQKKSNWCWAACAEMAGVVVHPASPLKQTDVVKHLKRTEEENYPNVSGKIEDCAAGAQYVARDLVKFDSIDAPWNFSQIAMSLAKGYPVQAAAGYYTGNTRNGGHVVVIYMTQFIDNSAGTSYYIDYCDPWDGTTHHCTLSSFLDGSYNSRKYDKTAYVVW